MAIVGGGFAGCEAAWQLARRGIGVDLFEMRPGRQTEVHRGGDLAEPVCSNSFKARRLENAHGLLKAEMACQHSLIMEGAEATKLPAGQALAVDREAFGRWITAGLTGHPAVRIRREEITDPAPLLASHARVILATGPLTSPGLCRELVEYVGAGSLYYYDAIAPTVTTDSLDMEQVFRASRYGKGSDDYLNCPMTREQYMGFVEALLLADKVPSHPFENPRHFEGCLPIEVMAERGEMTLAFGPMKPVGLPDPRTGRPPFAVVQLRQENEQASLYGLVGFQTKMTWPEQRRLFRTIPGLEGAEFARLGSMHRNTFFDSPRLLDDDLALRVEPRLQLAGQIVGVEGYIESAAMGLHAGKRAAFALLERELPRPSAATMTGALLHYVTGSPSADFQPMNANMGLLEPAPPNMKKKEKRAFMARRAMKEMEELEAMEGLPGADTAATWEGG